MRIYKVEWVRECAYELELDCRSSRGRATLSFGFSGSGTGRVGGGGSGVKAIGVTRSGVGASRGGTDTVLYLSFSVPI